MKNKLAINAIKEDNCCECYGSREDCEMCAYGVAMEALRELEQHCGNCIYHDELNFHNPTDCWCSKRHIYTYADMHCTDWSDEE